MGNHAADGQEDPRRETWKHEDDLINHRLTWLLASQTLLLGAYGLLNQRLTDWYFCPTKRQRGQMEFLMKELPSIGRWLSVALGVGLLAALAAMIIIKTKGQLGDKSDKLSLRFQKFWMAVWSKSGPDVHPWTTLGGWIAAISLPIIFCVAWHDIEKNQLDSPRSLEGTVSKAKAHDPPNADDQTCYPQLQEKREPPPAPSASPVCPPAICPPPSNAGPKRKNQSAMKPRHSHSRRADQAISSR